MAITQPEQKSTIADVATGSMFPYDMDFLTGTSDHTLSTDVLNSDLWTNVSSPNSLYDHDKVGRGSCLPSTSFTIADEFDLQPQFEHSDNILISYDAVSPLPPFNTEELFIDGNNITDWSDLCSKNQTPKTDIEFLRNMTSNGNSQLTLSQLNSNYDDTNSQKSFANSISSEDLAVLETMFVRPMPSLSDDKVKGEVLPDCAKETVNQWIQQTTAVKTEPNGNRPFCKENMSMQGFSPHVENHPIVLPQEPAFLPKSTSFTKAPLTSGGRMPQQGVPEGDVAQTFHDLKAMTDKDIQARFEYLLKSRDDSKHQVATITSESGEKLNEKWEEIKLFLRNEPEPGTSMKTGAGRPKRQRFDSGSSVWTSEYDSSDDSFHSDDEDSDASDSSWKIEGHARSQKSQKHSFWQYNLQSKGPKGKRLIDVMKPDDPHVLPEVEDPVFDQTKYKVTLTHGGKARRGDGNDVLPNPKKLYNLGSELKRLMKQINVFSPMNDMPANMRNKSRKEKNKIASRVCRLRKKAQHEANKVKRHGLDHEHSRLMEAMRQVKLAMYKRVRGNTLHHSQSLSDEVNQIIDSHLSAGIRVAGNTVDYVNKVLDNVSTGDDTGGLVNM